MDYGIVDTGIFLKRMNRFAAEVEIHGKTETVHVKNTGRLRELLVPGVSVIVKFEDHPNRKTKWDLIAVEHEGELVNIDSQAPNHVFGEYARSGRFRPGIQKVRPEFTYGDSRFDFCLQYEGCTEFVEVKGVTLLRDGKAYFPDAPTERGIKHLRGLQAAAVNGYKASIAFVIQRKHAAALLPNDLTQPEFGAALREAERSGVQVYAYDCIVTENQLTIDQPVRVEL